MARTAERKSTGNGRQMIGYRESGARKSRLDGEVIESSVLPVRAHRARTAKTRGRTYSAASASRRAAAYESAHEKNHFDAKSTRPRAFEVISSPEWLAEMVMSAARAMNTAPTTHGEVSTMETKKKSLRRSIQRLALCMTLGIFVAPHNWFNQSWMAALILFIYVPFAIFAALTFVADAKHNRNTN
jgi:hypothetical protein